MAKGIPIDQLPKRRVTDENSVTAFFEKNREMAYTIDLLLENGFTTNIRKVVRRLSEKGILEEVSIQKGKRWEFAYYYSSSTSYFDLKKTKLGWLLSEIHINGIKLEVELEGYIENGDFYLYMSSSAIKDIAVYYYDESNQIRSIRYSEISDQMQCDNPSFHALLTPEADPSDEFLYEYDHDGKQERIRRSRSRSHTNSFIQHFGNPAFKFTIDEKQRFIIISALIWDEEEEEDDEDFVIGDVSLGCFDVDHEEEQDDNIHVGESERIVISY